jgi:hypothetical protein
MYHGKNSTVAIYQAEVLDQRPPIVRLTDRLDIHWHRGPNLTTLLTVMSEIRCPAASTACFAVSIGYIGAKLFTWRCCGYRIGLYIDSTPFFHSSNVLYVKIGGRRDSLHQNVRLATDPGYIINSRRGQHPREQSSQIFHSSVRSRRGGNMLSDVDKDVSICTMWLKENWRQPNVSITWSESTSSINE